ncbi:hypothetical protein TGAM01_v203866 [Trichoderma gamsii]|uniref:Uncharacterized protein n=1 Tax=Trichoderma gamsii TaxID=398673 RepID=A0A2P4ZT62_9HYPO|nr:hypothetical protein TGAM01_v203866 [Trichoderma gamsii]PON27485.1 hypothetical protein TGAM01_v203866 [Trichoderma gamsii]
MKTCLHDDLKKDTVWQADGTELIIESTYYSDRTVVKLMTQWRSKFAYHLRFDPLFVLRTHSQAKHTNAIAFFSCFKPVILRWNKIC